MFGMPFQDDFKCPICDTRHSLRHCRAFLQMALVNKEAYVRSPDFCLNCLSMSHTVLNCPLQTGCPKCNNPHHTLLHPINLHQKLWVRMTAAMMLTSPGKIDSPVLVRAFLDPFAESSSTFFGYPLPLAKQDIGLNLPVVLSSEIIMCALSQEYSAKDRPP
ncbi:uncharacterized protein LOC131994271 [Stomoxys calcitrans]|uniref:uncharacterized protein LOC131994271 n=1 Tax=Stomoxys calcitrans TaxID=35570 RepID=UPI0027E31361|nr:uncharacterized protein LOC131994271 [Stomoxys calcitrans]